MFVVVILDLEHKVFIVHVAALNINLGCKIYPVKKAPIAYLKADKAYTKVFSKYIDCINIFLSKLVAKLFEHMNINNHAIQWVDN